MLSQHDHYRVGSRIMFSAAIRTDARPPAAVRFSGLPADRAVQVPAVPIGEAERRSKGWRLTFVEQRQQMNMGISIGRGFAVRQMRETRRFAFKAEKQHWLGSGGLPAELALFIEDGGTLAPHQLPSVGAGCERRDSGGIGAQMIGAVQPRSAEEWIRLQALPFVREPLRPPSSRASAARLRQSTRAAATNHRRPARRAR